MALLCVSIDLDEIDCYYAIHGLGKPPEGATRVIYRRALPRIARFLDEIGVSATLFAVGKDLADEGDGETILRELSGTGHEIGNHSMNHRYDLTLLSQGEIGREIDEAARVISVAVGVTPKGFRAPGYNIHQGITEMLRERGYTYDSSVFPCPAYYAAKAAAMSVKSIQGAPSSSVMGDPRILSAPVDPYKIGDDGVWTRGNGLLELPITVLTPARLPFIGTSIAMMGTIPAVLLARSAAKRPFVNLELHGIDFADAEGDGLGDLKEHQPDLRIPYTKRRRTLSKVIKTLLDGGMEPVTLQQAAGRLFIS